MVIQKAAVLHLCRRGWIIYLIKQVMRFGNQYYIRYYVCSYRKQNFFFCDKNMCPLFVSEEIGRLQKHILGKINLINKMSDFPETLALSHDSA